MILSRSVDEDNTLTEIFDYRGLTGKIKLNMSSNIYGKKKLMIPDGEFQK